MSARLVVTSYIDDSFRRLYEVLAHSIPIDVLELGLILFEKRDLSFKENITEVDDLFDIRHFEAMFKYASPDLEHLADFANFRSTSRCAQLISMLLLTQFKLKLEAKEEHAGRQYTRLVLEQASVQSH